MTLETLQNQPVIKISSGHATASVMPSHGARLLSWSVPDWDILRWPSECDWDRIPKVRGGDLVLFPFIARTFANGRIGFWIDDAGVQRPAPMHGFAKDSPFRIVSSSPDSVTLRLDSNETTMSIYPFAFCLEVTYRIEADSLLTAFHVLNRGDGPMPWSAGHHYYFHIPAAERPAWHLSLPCQKWGRQNYADGSIAFEPASHQGASLDDPAWIDRFHANPDFARVELFHSSSGRAIVFENPSHLPESWPCVTTWTEKPESDFFCVEPWSAYPNAIHNKLGLRSLQPGASDEVSCRVRIRTSTQPA